MTAPTAFSAFVNQLTAPEMAHLAMTHEALCATFRAAADVLNLAYVPSTIFDYFELLNRPVNLANAFAVGVSAEPLPAAIPFSKVLADTHAFQSAFDLHVALMHCNMVHPATQGPALTESQAVKNCELYYYFDEGL